MLFSAIFGRFWVILAILVDFIGFIAYLNAILCHFECLNIDLGHLNII
jgi:hypothetical protein